MTAKLKGRMMQTGSIMISYQPLGMYPNFFRSIISNQAIQGHNSIETNFGPKVGLENWPEMQK